jgi:hemin uptake protein HemP
MNEEHRAKTWTHLKTLVQSHAIKITADGPGLLCVRSDDLLGKDREILIEHSGVHYRLRITRANKLILTK